MKKKNLSLMCAAMLAATAIPANFAMADKRCRKFNRVGYG